LRVIDRSRLWTSAFRARSKQEGASMARDIQRSVLPVPDQPSFGLVTYDARDPDTKFPPIEPLRPPEGAPDPQGTADRP
jgi:hypothetical protein